MLWKPRRDVESTARTIIEIYYRIGRDVQKSFDIAVADWRLTTNRFVCDSLPLDLEYSHPSVVDNLVSFGREPFNVLFTRSELKSVMLSQFPESVSDAPLRTVTNSSLYDVMKQFLDGSCVKNLPKLYLHLFAKVCWVFQIQCFFYLRKNSLQPREG